MGPLKVVLLTESNSLTGNDALPYKYYGQKLWEKIQLIVEELHYRCESVDLHKLDFQEHESVNKFLNADIVIMDVTNPDRRPTFMYHKGNRESMDCMDDIVLIQASGVENDNAIQDLKTTCKIKLLIVYRYDESKDVFYDTTQSSSPLPFLDGSCSSSNSTETLLRLNCVENFIAIGLSFQKLSCKRPDG
ncbi:unnamed protein product, partial [Rotaria sp. Silwood2]